MKKIGILTYRLGFSQKDFLIIKNVNLIVKNNPEICPVVFRKTCAMLPCLPRFALMEEKEIWGFDGIAIATTLGQANMLAHIPQVTKRFFYVWDLEWIYQNGNYVDYTKIYQHPNLELIARNTDHAKVIEKCWKKPITTIEDFQYDEIIKLAD